MMTGGKKAVDLADTNSLEYDELANFAVDQHNNQQVRELVGFALGVTLLWWRVALGTDLGCRVIDL